MVAVQWGQDTSNSFTQRATALRYQSGLVLTTPRPSSDTTISPTYRLARAGCTRPCCSTRTRAAWSDHLCTELALDALALALRARRPGAGLVHHTDRGCQYTAATYRARLAAHDITCSMSRTGECLDNALAERFFATRKAECLDTRPWPTRAAARLAIFAWVEVWYNRQRARSALGYRAPVAYEEQQLLLLQDLVA